MIAWKLAAGSLAIKIASELYDSFKGDVEGADQEAQLQRAVASYSTNIAKASAAGVAGDNEAAQEAKELAAAAKATIVGLSAIEKNLTAAKLRHIARKHIVPLAVRVLSEV